jgi:transcriptional regulator with XRE-family HTH domain
MLNICGNRSHIGMSKNSMSVKLNAQGSGGLQGGAFVPPYLHLKRKEYSALKEIRRSRGLTLEALSELTGISPSYLSRLEAGARRLNTDLINKLSTVLGCSPADLISSGVAPNITNPIISGIGSNKPYAGLNEYTKHGMNMPTEETFAFKKDLPIYALVHSGQDHPLTNYKIDFQSTADWMFRPYDLLEIKNSFGVYVCTDQYSPRYNSGNIVLTHPARPLVKGCDCFVLLQDDMTLLSTFFGWEKDKLLLSSFERPHEAFREIPRQELKAIYKIINICL